MFIGRAWGLSPDLHVGLRPKAAKPTYVFSLFADPYFVQGEFVFVELVYIYTIAIALAGDQDAGIGGGIDGGIAGVFGYRGKRLGAKTKEF